MKNLTHIDLGVKYTSETLSACEDITGKQVNVYIYDELGATEVLVINATISQNVSVGPMELRGLHQNVVFGGASFSGMTKGDQIEISGTCLNDGIYDVACSNDYFCIQSGKMVVSHFFQHEILSDAASWDYHEIGRYQYEITTAQQIALSNYRYYYKIVLEDGYVKEKVLKSGVFCLDK